MLPRSHGAVIVATTLTLGCGGARQAPSEPESEPMRVSLPPSAPTERATVPPGADAGAQSSADRDEETDAAGADPGVGCRASSAAKAACDARGPGYRYGQRPVVYCSGVAPRPGQIEAMQRLAQQAACECLDEAALEAHRRECGRVPSMPRRGADPVPGGR